MEVLPGNIFIIVLILTRISAFFLILPVFGSQGIPTQIKMAVVLLLTIFFAVYFPCPAARLNSPTLLEAAIMMSSEILCGLLIGVIVASLFAIVKIAGEIIEMQIGFTMSEVLDPTTGESGQPLSIFLDIIFMLFFLSANGHHIFLRLMQKSFMVYSPAALGDVSAMLHSVIAAGSTMLIVGLQLAAPILGAYLLLMIGLSILARITPEMNIFFISPPITITLGLTMLIVFMPFIQSFVSEFAELMTKLLPV